MKNYSVQRRGRIFVKDYGFLSFAKSMSKNVGKNISKNVSGKYSPGVLAIRQKLLNHAKQPATNALKILQREQYKKQQTRLVI